MLSFQVSYLSVTLCVVRLSLTVISGLEDVAIKLVAAVVLCELLDRVLQAASVDDLRSDMTGTFGRVGATADNIAVAEQSLEDVRTARCPVLRLQIQGIRR